MACDISNGGGEFDPDNTGGVFAVAGVSQLQPMVPMRFRATWAGVTYGVWRGFTDSFTPDDQQTGYGSYYAVCKVAGTDALKVLAGLNVVTGGSVGGGEDSGARISRLLDKGGWYTGTGYRTIETGNSNVQATTFGDSILNLIQVTADSEIGEFYLDGSGVATYRNRHALLEEARSNTPQAVFGDVPGTVQPAGTELAYITVARGRDDTTIANDIQAQSVGGSAQEVTDAASIAQYRFARTYSYTSLILTSDPETLNWSQWILYVAKTPESRFDQLVIAPAMDPNNLWPQALGRQLGDRIQIVRRPAVTTNDLFLENFNDFFGQAAFTVIKDCFIRGIHHEWDMDQGTWLTTFTLQDASKYGSFLTLGNSTLGKLDSNALAY
jgi:hypothetical protein